MVAGELNSGLTKINFRGLVAVMSQSPQYLRLEDTDEPDLPFITSLLSYNNYS